MEGHFEDKAKVAPEGNQVFLWLDFSLLVAILVLSLSQLPFKKVVDRF